MDERKLLGKFIIKGTIKVLTGLHIGGKDLGISIGGMDNPIVRNPINGEPYVPGSSLKGKMRALMERALNKKLELVERKNKIRRHECKDPDCKICRVYGASKEENIPSRLIVRDAFLTEESIKKLENMETDTRYAEWKTENSLDRITCAAVPRPIERVPAGAEFGFELIYTNENEKHCIEDLNLIKQALELVEDDYLGGGGSRGNGKVKFEIKEIIYKPVEYYISGDPSKIVRKELKKDEKFDEIIKEMLNGK
ncbi:CRISPR-associated protein Csm3 [Thermosipho affectus]|uniref:CRISPR system Cms endoribonuclease Csm3 n=1 Tax=Thermosipho affectus TaxID=660294 RepID=A0ABX3IF33_9BACT|nr:MULTISPECIES: type III-A CRISPR-associated RAMP protein Csm3 [Thermosipho]ANQ54513.1 CRISPR-associated protein Csm3 [Thermosipho sp. 1070]APT72955.1 CRISPR-associated protein Csm3 [Thermosipho sp. 1063]ONN26432.1 CRISPR-associated protein Csm3 [Thermosipho affectus]OOC42405.1 CRISPR-associated protein Csm3 [Thermosipho sp. 1074]